MPHILAIDQGTSSSRAVLFDADGRQKASAQQPFDALYPHDGWVEQDPGTLWRTVLDTGRRAIAESGIPAADIAAIGIVNQRETTLVWDAETGEPVGNAIVWQDRRTAAHCEAIERQGLAGEIAAITGLVVDPYFSSTKLAWQLGRPGVMARARAGKLRFGTVDSFLIWRLTKGARHATDATNAARTQLFDIGELTWSERLLQYFDIPPAVLPTVGDCAGDFGMADREWFGAPIPIRGVAGDQQAALVGQACFAPGMAKCTFGTGCFLIVNTGAELVRSNVRLLTTIGYRLGDQPSYAIEGSIFNAGVAIKWLRDRLGIIDSAAETEAAARRIDGNTGGVFVVPAFTGLGAPHWNADARGLVAGLTLDSGRDHIVTATLKGVGFQTADLLAAAATDGIAATALRVDGGMVANDWFCQFLADACGIDVQRPANVETTVLGAGILAAVGAGLYPDPSAASRVWQGAPPSPKQRPAQRFSPAIDANARQDWLRDWHAAVARAL